MIMVDKFTLIICMLPLSNVIMFSQVLRSLGGWLIFLGIDLMEPVVTHEARSMKLPVPWIIAGRETLGG
jgi:hypothetical protein